MMRRQKPFGAFVIRDVCWMHEHAQQETIRINPALPFASVDFFSPIIAALAACFGRFDRLGVQDADGWLQVAIQRLSRQLTQRIIDFDACSITIPWVERGTNGTHRRNIRRKQTPLAGSAMFGAQRVDDRSQIDIGRVPALR
jgi:hypothetical protein